MTRSEGSYFRPKKLLNVSPAAFTSGTAELESEECRFRDLTDSVRAAGNFGVIEQQYAHNFAETEGNDRQIVAAQAKHREAEQEAGPPLPLTRQSADRSRSPGRNSD